MSIIYGVLTTAGGQGISLGADANTVGVSPYGLVVTGSSAYNAAPAFVIPMPGFYFVSGSTTCTGTIPNAAAFPGGQVFVTMANPNACQLSGSAIVGGTAFAYSGMAATGSLSGSNPTQRGNLLTLDSAGSVALQSDGLRWIPFASSGSLRIGI